MISSTAADLPEHRKQAFDACLREGILPIGMEHLPARDETGVQVSLNMVDQADIYIGIYGWRYGWTPDGSDISITEMEFNRALERKDRGELREILVFIMDDDHPTMRRDVEADAIAQEKLTKFKERAATGRIRQTFRSAEELRGLLIQSLADFKRRLSATTGIRSTPADEQLVSPRPTRTQSEFVQQLMTDFRSKPGVNAAFNMLDDYRSRRIDFGPVGLESENRFQQVGTNMVTVALAESDSDTDPEELVYNAIRDCFDAFFDGLEVVELSLRNGVIHFQDVDALLGYWIRQFADPATSRKGPEFVAAAVSYVTQWYPGEVEQLIARLVLPHPNS